MPKMTFEEFQASRREVSDLGAELQDAAFEDCGIASGLVYLNTLYIQHVTDNWPQDARARGAFYLVIGNAEWISDDLTSLERKLYEFADGEGYLE